MIHSRPVEVPPFVASPVVFCHLTEAIPELDMKAGDEVIITDLGAPYGVVLRRYLDPETARALITHSSVYPVPLARHVSQLPSPPVSDPAGKGLRLLKS